MQSPVHFYHVWLGGDWPSIWDEHFELIDESRFRHSGDVYVGLVGNPEDREHAMQMLPSWAEVVVQEDAGWEDVTLRPLHEFALEVPDDTPILYTHNKGSLRLHGGRTRWRRAMDDWLLRNWRDRVAELETNDISAWYWLNESVECAGGMRLTPVPIAPGNFWWANAGYIKQLGPLPVLYESVRIWGEEWVGTKKPRVASFKLDEWPRIEVKIKDEHAGWFYFG